MTEVRDKVRDYIASEFLYDRDASVLDGNSHLIEAEVLDSLKIFALVPFLEEEFGVKIEADDVVLQNFESIDAIERLIVTKQGGA